MAKLLHESVSSMFMKEDMTNISCLILQEKVMHGQGISGIMVNDDLIRQSIDKLQDNTAAGIDEFN